MRYIVYLPKGKNSYKLFETDKLETAIQSCHESTMKFACECCIYDTNLKSNNITKIIKAQMSEI